jgi:hypothetical protein
MIIITFVELFVELFVTMVRGSLVVSQRKLSIKRREKERCFYAPTKTVPPEKKKKICFLFAGNHKRGCGVVVSTSEHHAGGMGSNPTPRK